MHLSSTSNCKLLWAGMLIVAVNLLAPLNPVFAAQNQTTHIQGTLPSGSQSTDLRSGGSTAKHGRFLGAATTSYPTWFKESFLEFREDISEAAEAGKRVMVIFHQDGCPYCNALVEKNFAQKDIVELTRANFDVIAVNMWGDKEVVSVNGQAFSEKEFAAALRVQFTPTILFFTEDAKTALRLNGYLPPSEFKHALEYVAARRENVEPYRRFLKRVAQPRTANSGIARHPYLLNDLSQLHPRDGGKPIAVLFEQHDCPNCATLHSRVLADAQTQSLLSKFDAYQLDMWSEESLTLPDGRKLSARAWADELGIVYAPSLILFDGMGAEVIRSDAYFKRFHVQGLLDYVASGKYSAEPSFQRYLTTRAEALREQGIDVNIWE
jgi:thioredoxin-related protein